MKQCNTTSLPCKNPLFEFQEYQKGKDNLCSTCQLKKNCHHYTKLQLNNPLTKLQKHLYLINAINSDNKLTRLGEIARYFPQSGGLLLASMIEQNELTKYNLLEACQLIGALTTAFYKKPTIPNDYSFPFSINTIRSKLHFYYPFDQFPDLYDPPRGKRTNPVFKDFNPNAGYFVREWCEGISWDSLASKVTSGYYSKGDVIQVIRRVTTYIQSIVQLNQEPLSTCALELKNEILRDPIKVLI